MLKTTSHSAPRRERFNLRTTAALALLVAVMLALPLFLSGMPYIQNVFILAFYMTTMSLAWNLLGGMTGQKYYMKYVINEQGLDDAIGLEVVNIFTDKNGEDRVASVQPLKMTGHEGNN